MTDYFDTVSVTGNGATSIGSAVSTLVDTASVTGTGAVSIGSAASTLADTVSVTGNGAVSSLSFMFNDLDNYNVKSWAVRKSIQEVMWTFNGQIDGHSVPSYFTQLQIFADDYADVTQCLFIGLIPGASYALASVNNTSNITGYDYGWYLSAQFVPESLRQTDEDTNPADTIESMLGGVDWYTTTGIEPYEIRTVSDWASIKKSYVWDAKTTKWKAIKEICEHTSHVFVVKWRETVGNQWYPCAYFVHEDDIDTYLDLPAKVTITSPDDYLVSGVTVEDRQDEKYNRVTCNGVDRFTGTWYQKVVESAAVTAGDELPIEYIHESTDMDTQAKTDAKATELYNFFNTIAKVYTATFVKRYDFQLYQLIAFSGYDKITTDDMRIISITYSRSLGKDLVTIQCTPDQSLSALQRLQRSMGANFMNEQQKIKEDFFIDLTKISVGTVTAIDGSEATVQLEKDGGYVKARIIG